MWLTRRDILKLGAGLAIATCVGGVGVKYITTETLTVADIRKIPLKHRYTLLSAQGVCNKYNDMVYFIWEHGREFFFKRRLPYEPESKLWLDIYARKWLVKLSWTDPIEILHKTLKYLEGYVVWDPTFIHSLNVATTIAGVENALIVHPEFEHTAQRLGLKKLYDLRKINENEWNSNVVRCYEWQFEKFFSRCNKEQIAFNGGFRFEIDYAISNEMCSVALDPSDQIQQELLLKYYKGIEYYGLNMGYPWTTKLEKPMVETASKAGLRTGLMPSLRGAPFALNYSVHSRMPKEEYYHQEIPIEVEYSDDKVYLAFGLSDLGFGMLQGFYYDQWYDPFRLDEKRTVKLSWWMDALAIDIAPQIAKYFYDTRHPKLDIFYSAHVYGRIRPSDFPNLEYYLLRGKDKLKQMNLKVVAFSNHRKWDEKVFDAYSTYLKDTVVGFVYGFGREFGDIQYKIVKGMPWVFTTFLYHGNPNTARLVYDYIKKHKNPQFLVYGCAFGYQIPYAKVVQWLQYINNYLKEKLGNKYVNVNAVELCYVLREKI